MHPLKRWMEEWGVRQEEMADALDIDQTYISKIIRGHRKPSKALASKIARFTSRKVTVDQIMAYELPKGVKAPKHRPRGRSAPKANGAEPLAQTKPPGPLH